MRALFIVSSSSRARLDDEEYYDPKERQLENIWHSEDNFVFLVIGRRLFRITSSPERSQGRYEYFIFFFRFFKRGGEGGGGTTKAPKKLTSPVSKDQFVNFFRMALPYITMHKSAIFVIHIPGNVMKDKKSNVFKSVMQISLS